MFAVRYLVFKDRAQSPPRGGPLKPAATRIESIKLPCPCQELFLNILLGLTGRIAAGQKMGFLPAQGPLGRLNQSLRSVAPSGGDLLF
jgi:hypothetical protein